MVIKNFNVSFSELPSQKSADSWSFISSILRALYLAKFSIIFIGIGSKQPQNLSDDDNKTLFLVHAACPLQIVRVPGVQHLILG